MYHDQGLPVIKHVGFGNAVNVTLGLPILRTSVDHGTALSLARTGKADAGSLRAAVALAIDLAGTSSARCRSVSDSASIFCTIPGSSAGSSTPWRRPPSERIVEVGPGRGALTWGLLERARQLGRDRDRSRPGAGAQVRSARPSGLRVHVEDVLDTDFVRLARRQARRCASSAIFPTTFRRRCCSGC